MKVVALLVKTYPSRFALGAGLALLAGIANATLFGALATALAHPLRGALLWTFALAAIASVAMSQISHAQIVRLTGNVLAELRTRLAREILAAPYAQVESIGGPRLLAALTEDVDAVREASDALIGIAMATATVLGIFGYVMWLSPLLFLFVAGPLAISVLASQRVTRMGLKYVRMAWGIGHARVARAYGAVVDGAKELKLHRPRRAAFVTDGLRPATKAFHEPLYKGVQLWTWANAVNLAVVFLTVAAVMFVWPRISSGGQTTAAQAALAVLYLPASIAAVLHGLDPLRTASAAVETLEELGLSLAEREEGTGAIPSPPKSARIELRGVTYRYGDDDRHFAVGPIDLEIVPGTIVFFTGGNGSGKTTLMKLITGLYSPQKGEVALDGKPVDEAGLERYRNLFAAVFADVHLFDRLYGFAAPAVDAKAPALVTMLELDGIVGVKDGAFTRTELSHGQRKRLALLVALLHDRPIYVLDEWAAEQDPSFKAVFYRTLLPKLRAEGKTVIAITHDDRYFDCADRIVHLADGKVRA